MQRALDEVEPTDEEHAAGIRERLVQKLQRLRDRMMPEMIAEGWSYDEANDQMVPPGWVRAAPVDGEEVTR